MAEAFSPSPDLPVRMEISPRAVPSQRGGKGCPLQGSTKSSYRGEEAAASRPSPGGAHVASPAMHPNAEETSQGTLRLKQD